MREVIINFKDGHTENHAGNIDMSSNHIAGFITICYYDSDKETAQYARRIHYDNELISFVDMNW
jgi:hypothetical protein